MSDQGEAVVDETENVDDEDGSASVQQWGMRLIAKELWRLHEARATGELASIRRMDRRAMPPATFHRLMARAGFTEMSPETVGRWSQIVGIMAQRPDALRASGLGEAMAAVGISESRLDMMLTAQGTALNDLARRTALRIARDHDSLPYRDLCELLLYDGRGYPDDNARGDKTRIRIAQSFIRANTNSDKAGG